MRSCVARDAQSLQAAIEHTDILCVGGLWHREFLARATRLKLIQATSVGTDTFDIAALRQRGVRLCNSSGLTANAVAEHALALMLAIRRHLAAARDRQHARAWRGMLADPKSRPGELGGQTVVIVGLGTIGSRLATFCRAFGMRVIAARRDAATCPPEVDEVVALEHVRSALPEADFVCLTCPLTPVTRGLIDAAALAAMKPSAHLVNVARGPIVVEAALIEALQNGAIAGAALDCFEREPLPDDSPLWRLPNVIMTPHIAGDTEQFEARFIDLLIDNLARLADGRALRNEVL